MTMNVNIGISGDVIIYDKGGFWNFVFVTDDHHEVEYTVGGLKKTLRSANSDRILKLDCADEQSGATRTWGANADKIFNMGDNKLHGSTGGNSHLEVRHSSPPYRETVHLRVSGGIVDAASWYSNYIYSSFPGGNERSYGPAAKLIVLSFDLENVPHQPAMQLTDEISGQLVDSWQYRDGSFEITIDNDCKGMSTAIDFLHYYDWVRDVGLKRRFFVARKDPAATIIQGLKVPVFREFAEAKILGPDGNCDPTRIFPPPLP